MNSTIHTKKALVLAGGGLAGVMYEIGALCAIDELLHGLTVNNFDIYVGTSAGSLVASLVANGMAAREAMAVIQHEHPDINGFNVQDVFHANYEGLFRRLGNLPKILSRIGRDLLHPTDFAISDVLWELGQLLPTGLYNGNSIEKFLESILTHDGYSNHFAQLQKELYIVATELDSGQRAVFGAGQLRDVPISEAVAASSAVPVLYRPMRINDRDYIDGSLHGAASLDLAIETGAQLIICINPLVPLDADRLEPGAHYIRKHGLNTVINQTLRTLMSSSLRYHVKHLRAKYPNIDIILVQPQWDDQRMFHYNPMHYRSRHEVVEHGFHSVTNGFLHNIGHFRTTLAKYGIELAATRTIRSLDLSTIDDAIAAKPASPPANNGANLSDPLAPPTPNHHRHAIQTLQRNLSQLEAILAAAVKQGA